MLGDVEIRKIRMEAERGLGARFDIREFHDRVLGNGGVTLAMLRRQVEHGSPALRRLNKYSARPQAASQHIGPQRLTR
jgi:Bacterial protein of unknown function (DUF885)